MFVEAACHLAVPISHARATAIEEAVERERAHKSHAKLVFSLCLSERLIVECIIVKTSRCTEITQNLHFSDIMSKPNNGETASALKGKEGVCRIEVSRVDWIVEQPWQRAPQSKSSGTGFVIEGERILTNAHVVRAGVDIRVRQHGSTRRFPANVVIYAPDVDLAILEIVPEEKADFFQSKETDEEMANGDEEPPSKRSKSSLALQFADELPALQESVHVVGFPTVCVHATALCASCVNLSFLYPCSLLSRTGRTYYLHYRRCCQSYRLGFGFHLEQYSRHSD